MKYLSPLQVILFIVGIIFVFFAVDGFKRKRLNILHFIIFFGGSAIVILFSISSRLLEAFGKYFGVARWSDLLVYLAIILLWYLFLMTNNRLIKNGITTTKLARAISIQWARWSLQNTIDTVIIMPTYRQSKKVKDLIQQILDIGIGVVCVDDGYNGDLADYLCKEFETENVVILSHPFNMWQGAALQTGQQYIIDKLPHIHYIIHFDSDGQHQVKDIAQFKSAFQNNPSLDIVLWSRFLEWSGTIPFYRKLHKKLQLLFTKILIGIRLTDTHNGFRMIHRKAIEKLEITMNDFTHASEIEFLIKNNKLQYQEVPVDILYEDEHISWWQSVWNAFRIAKNIIYQLFFFR